MKAGTFVVSALLFTGAFIGLNLLSVFPAPNVPEKAVIGKKVWRSRNCVECHTVFGNGGYRGGDLTSVVKDGREKFVDYLVDPPVMWPNKKRRHPSLDRGEAEQLADYLEYISTVPTLGWPPEPKKRAGNL